MACFTNYDYVGAPMHHFTLLQQKLKRKGDQFSAPDQENYEKEVANANFRMDILTERASQHYKNSLEKFQELDRQLMDDPRL